MCRCQKMGMSAAAEISEIRAVCARMNRALKESAAGCASGGAASAWDGLRAAAVMNSYRISILFAAHERCPAAIRGETYHDLKGVLRIRSGETKKGRSSFRCPAPVD